MLVLTGLLAPACGGVSGRAPAAAPSSEAAPPHVASASEGKTPVPDPQSADTAALNTRLLRRPSAAGAAGDLPLGPGDLLEVVVFEVPELSNLKVRVSRPGVVVLPLLGEVPVSGKTPGEVEADLRQRLSRSYMYDPHVTVYVHERRSQRVSVIGAVRKGGVFELTGRLRLVDALALAEGLADDADHVVYLLRQVPAGTVARAQAASGAAPASTGGAVGGSGTAPAPTGGAAGPSGAVPTPTGGAAGGSGAVPVPTAGAAGAGDLGETEEIMTAINLDEIIKGREELNVQLEAGDVIQVPRSGSVYVGGSVLRPGSLPLKGKTTVHQAILAVGGASNVAALADVRLYRTQANGPVQIISLDLNEFEEGKGSPELQKNDVVIVGKSAIKAFFFGVYELFRGMFGVGVAL